MVIFCSKGDAFMHLYLVCLCYFLFAHLAMASEENDSPVTFIPLLSSEKLIEVPPSRFSSKIPSKSLYSISDLEEIYSTLQIHNYSRLQTLRALKLKDKYQKNSLYKAHLIPTVNRILQKHINNIYSLEDKIFLINNISDDKKNSLNILKKLIIETNFDYRRASDIAFQLFGPYADMDYCITITKAYEKEMDNLFALFAQSTFHHSTE